MNDFAGRYDWIDDVMEIFALDIVWLMLSVMVYLWFTGREDNQRTVFYAFLTASISLLLAIFFISPEVNHARPFVQHQVIQLIPHAPDPSFPSDHAVLAFSLAFSVLFAKRKLGLVMILLALATGIARVYVGVHYPADILGAIVLSFGMSFLVWRGRKKLESIPNFFIRLYQNLLNRLFGSHE
ncbi:undecaprenyl-diphosphatase [Paenibacillus sp. HB172176]|uniref:undecaprenyl-diphosphatase n=1 Tax=Paenibacillus sp. HB172176 TaxID=2493690 RepID=UPI001438936E|nr:undecaprenyl-diphosphatase [Paenibacillus sp. HB172176]